MPQMAPMSWTFLSLLFLVCLILVMTMNYFIIQPKPMISTKNSLPSKFNSWKW